MFRETVDRYDDLRREWIAEHAGIFTMQIRRAELLNRRIRRRNRDLSGARPNPYDDHPSHPLFARGFSTVESKVELALVLLAAAAAPIGWPAGRFLYRRIEALIPDRLRAYPVPACLFASVVVGVVTSLAYLGHGPGLGAVVLAPWLLAQLPAAFLAAGVYGILNGWLAIDGSTDWWPLTPPPPTVDLVIPLAPDDLTAPPIFDTAEAPVSSQDLTPISRARGRSVGLIVAGLIACSIGALWTVGSVVVGVKSFVTQSVTAPAVYDASYR